MTFEAQLVQDITGSQSLSTDGIALLNAPVIEATHAAADIEAAELDHPVWSQTARIPITRYWSGEAAPASRYAEARVVWSEAALHVRFACPQDEPLVVSPNPQMARKTLGLWDRDVCEIFIAPDLAEPNNYFEFEAAPTGEWVDLAIRMTSAGRETDFNFHSGMTAATRIGDDGIVVAMRIPWSERIPQPQSGERWRVNLFRCVGSDPTRGYLAWRPTYAAEPSFHSPEVFGWLVFKD